MKQGMEVFVYDEITDEQKNELEAEIKKLDGVIDIKEENNKYIISIEDDSYTNKIFKEISKYDIKMFSEEDPSLNEIFLSVVGENYE